MTLITCTRCVMDTTDPDITFDAAGVCNHCHDHDRLTAQMVVSGDAGRRRLEELVATIKRDGEGRPYDCVIGMSGGVDSTFVAYEAARLGLRPLAVHLDNGWNSEIATSNIAVALKTLGIDLETLVIDWEEFKDIQLAFLRSGVPDCEIPSDHAIVSAVYHTSRRMDIRHTVWGYNVRTETHLPKAWSQGHYDWGYIKAVHRRFGTGHIKTFPHLSFRESLPGFGFANTRLHLLDYIDYSKADARHTLERELGWRSYGGKHHENVYTRWYQGWFLPMRFGYDKRKAHLSSEICAGARTRESAIAELQQPAYDPELQRADTEYVKKKLGISPTEWTAIMEGPKRTFADFPSHEKLRNGALFRTIQTAYRFGRYRVLRPGTA
jgi:N-acetyl sugar amidotransferase